MLLSKISSTINIFLFKVNNCGILLIGVGDRMKLLKIKVKGLKNFDSNGVNINLYATKRVMEFDKGKRVHLVNKRIFSLNTLAILGLNASGKTNLVTLISEIITFYNSRKGLNAMNSLAQDKNLRTVINKENILEKLNLTTYWFSNSVKKQLFKLNTEIIVNNGYLEIVNEEIWIKEILENTSKKSFFEFTKNSNQTRKNLKEDLFELVTDVSIATRYFTQEKITVLNDIYTTNNRKISSTAIAQIEKENPGYINAIVKFLDITIKNLKITQEWFKLEFINHLKIDDQIINLKKYLSNGTYKALELFSRAYAILQTNGVLVIDQIESEFNFEIVNTLISLFNNKSTNPLGATLIFTTHYIEIVDHIMRFDAINITKKDKGVIKVEKLSSICNREENKVSNLYRMGKIKQVAPTHEDAMEVRKIFKTQHKKVKYNNNFN